MHVAREASEMIEQYSKDIGELSGSLNALCVVPLLHFQKKRGKLVEYTCNQDPRLFGNLDCNN